MDAAVAADAAHGRRDLGCKEPSSRGCSAQGFSWELKGYLRAADGGLKVLQTYWIYSSPKFRHGWVYPAREDFARVETIPLMKCMPVGTAVGAGAQALGTAMWHPKSTPKPVKSLPGLLQGWRTVGSNLTTSLARSCNAKLPIQRSVEKSLCTLFSPQKAQ